MSEQRSQALLIGCIRIGSGLLAPISVEALTLPAETLVVTDPDGKVLTDLHGDPAIGTIHGLEGSPESHSVSFEIVIPDEAPSGSASGIPALLVVQLIGFLAPARQAAGGQPAGMDRCSGEHGFEDVAPRLFGRGDLSFRVLVQSGAERSETVLEPAQPGLVGIGSAGLPARAASLTAIYACECTDAREPGRTGRAPFAPAPPGRVR